MYDMMKKQNFGVEIELTGITREQAANVIATYFGTQTRYLGTYYNTYGATDQKGRTWKAMSDGSIHTERKTSRGKVAAGREYSCEVVTPVLQYEDNPRRHPLLHLYPNNFALILSYFCAMIALI